jgi:hypothetical protein
MRMRMSELEMGDGGRFDVMPCLVVCRVSWAPPFPPPMHISQFFEIYCKSVISSLASGTTSSIEHPSSWDSIQNGKDPAFKSNTVAERQHKSTPVDSIALQFNQLADTCTMAKPFPTFVFLGDSNFTYSSTLIGVY